MSVIVGATGWLSFESPVRPEVLIWHITDKNLDGLVHASRIEHWIVGGKIFQGRAKIYLETLSGGEDLGSTWQNDRISEAREAG